MSLDEELILAKKRMGFYQKQSETIPNPNLLSERLIKEGDALVYKFMDKWPHCEDFPINHISGRNFKRIETIVDLGTITHSDSWCKVFIGD
jgi:hypothetical protein